MSGSQSAGPQTGGSRSGGVKTEGTRTDGARSDGARADGMRRGGPGAISNDPTLTALLRSTGTKWAAPGEVPGAGTA
jgi:hypothetical protein